jgi:hypothetical protein
VASILAQCHRSPHRRARGCQGPDRCEDEVVRGCSCKNANGWNSMLSVCIILLMGGGSFANVLVCAGFPLRGPPRVAWATRLWAARVNSFSFYLEIRNSFVILFLS